jgi:hypothetical protein
MFGVMDLFERFRPHGQCYLWRPNIPWLTSCPTVQS